jgi:thioester reductase-like protein
MGRLRFLITDITKPRLGLDGVHYQNFASGVDEIVFNSWNSNWGKPLEHFEPLIASVRNIIELCAASSRRPRITFISSVCSIGEWQREHPEQPWVPEEVAWDSASAMANGYGESKCIAEQLFAQAHAAFGLRVAIVRAGQIGGPCLSTVVYKGWPVQGWLYVIIKTSDELGYWPTHVMAIDWIPVDALAEGITNITTAEASDNAVQVYNMVHPHAARWSLLTKTLRSRFGFSAQEISLPEWLDMVDPQKFKMYAFLRAAGEGREHTLKYKQYNALEILPNVEVIEEEQLGTWMDGWQLKFEKSRARL